MWLYHMDWTTSMQWHEWLPVGGVVVILGFFDIVLYDYVGYDLGRGFAAWLPGVCSGCRTSFEDYKGRA